MDLAVGLIADPHQVASLVIGRIFPFSGYSTHLPDFLLQGQLALAALTQLHVLAVELFFALGQTAQDFRELPAGRLSLLAQRLQLGLRALLFPGGLEGERQSGWGVGGGEE